MRICCRCAFSRSYRHNDDDHIRSTLILDHILTRFKVDVTRFETTFGISFRDYFHKEYDSLKRL